MKKALALLAVAAFAMATTHAVQAAGVVYGSLGNFDCINDTGQTAHGFEIELDNCLPSAVSYTFGAPYNRYGTPTITTDGVNTFVRYTASYSGGAWSTGTDSGTYAPTGGHSLFFPQYGGAPAYPNVPGDHFGVGLNVNPSNTIYRWLLDDGSGNLVRAGTNVQIPAPVLVVAPPANPVNPVAVQAVVPAPPPEAGQQFADAIWVKVFITEVQNPDPVALEDLVIGNPAVPEDSETEIEWFLLQDNPARPDLGEVVDEGDLMAGNEAVTRRYEFYKYTGDYDPENHEALSDSYDPDLVGDFLGNQNVALNMLVVVPEPTTIALAIWGLAAGAVVAVRRKFVK